MPSPSSGSGLGASLRQARAKAWERRPKSAWEVARVLPLAGWPTVIVAVLAVVVSSALPVAFIVASSALVGAVPPAIGEGLSSPAGERLITALLVTAVLYVLQGVTSPLLGVVTTSAGRRVEAAIANRVMGTCASPAGVAHLEDPAALNLIAQAQGVGHQGLGPALAVKSLFDLAVSRIPAYLSALILATFNPVVSLGYLLFLYWMRQGNRREAERSIASQTGQSETLRRAHYHRDLALTGQHAKELRIFGLADWTKERFVRHWNKAMEELWTIRAQGFADIVKTTAALFVVEGLTVVFIVWSAAHGTIGAGELALYLQAVAAMRLGIGLFGNPDLLIQYASASMPAARSLEASLAPLPTGLSPTGGAAVQRRLPAHAIELEGVHFAYPGQDSSVLEGVDLRLKAGISHALVGANGAGKTTLLKLLCRFYDPTEGRVLVDGTDLRDIDPSEWHRQVAAIFQEFVRYEFSAADNVGLGNLRSLGDEHALNRAAAKAGADAVISRLPQKWSTPLARHLTGGADLSGGEWQRIALARAMMAAEGGAGLLILDEPTASLDMRAEAEVFDRFLEITEGLTTLLVSHRFSTVRRVDVIHVLEDGRVVEEGAHAELMALQGRYARMFNLQAARFREEQEEKAVPGG